MARTETAQNECAVVNEDEMELHEGGEQRASKKTADEVTKQNATTMIDSRIGRHIREVTLPNLGTGHDGGDELDEMIRFKVRCQHAWA